MPIFLLGRIRFIYFIDTFIYGGAATPQNFSIDNVGAAARGMAVDIDIAILAYSAFRRLIYTRRCRRFISRAKEA